MTNAEPFSFELPITAQERQQARQQLQVAFAQGRLDQVEYERRLALASGATTRPDFDSATAGLLAGLYEATDYAVYEPPAGTAGQVESAPWSYGLRDVDTEGRAVRGRGLAAVAHLSPYFAWLIGPALVYAVSSPGGFARKEAAKAFNFQLVWFIGTVLTIVVGGIFGMGRGLAVVLVLEALGWFVLTLLGGLKALQGIDWRNPVMRFIRWSPLEER